MTNILDSIRGVISVYTDDESKSPLHVGEVMNLWTYHTLLTEINRFVEVSLNSTGDDELRDALKKSFKDCHEHVEEIEALLRDEGISIPPTSERKPHTNPEDVPAGAKLTDDEIANGLSAKQVSAITLCAVGLTQSIRADIGNMWFRFFIKRVEYGSYFKPLLRKRGWIKVPPYYYPPGRPNRGS